MVKTLKPEGPGSNNLRVTKWHNGKLYALSGILPKEITPTISMYDDSWHSFETVGISDKTGHKFINANCIEIDTMDDNHVYVGAQTGLYEYRDFGFIKEYNRHNSILQTAQPMEDKAGYPDEKKKNYTEVTSLKYDKKGTLWIANSYAKRPTICYMSPNDTIKEYVHDNLMTKGYSFSMAQMSGMMIDSRGLLWFTNNNWTMPALVKYDIENNTTNVYTELINQDNTSYEFYNMPAIAEDKEGNIWVGTNVGLFCIMSSEINGNSNNIIFSQIKVPRNDGTNLADYLLSVKRVFMIPSKSKETEGSANPSYTLVNVMKVRDQSLCHTGHLFFVRQPCGRYDERPSEDSCKRELQKVIPLPGDIRTIDDSEWIEMGF